MDDCFRAVLDAGQSNCNIWYNYIQEGPRSTEVKQHKRALDHQCSFCGKTGGDSLRTCSVCRSVPRISASIFRLTSRRSVRYCNKACQTADYAGRHKRECKEFAYPPLTSAFITEPYGDRAYPPHPIFASGYETGEVGYWVSIRDQIEVECVSFGSLNIARHSPESIPCVQPAGSARSSASQVLLESFRTLQVIL